MLTSGHCGARTAETIEPVHHGFDLAVETTGRVDQLALAVKSLAPEGFCEPADNHFRPGELPLLDIGRSFVRDVPTLDGQG